MNTFIRDALAVNNYVCNSCAVSSISNVGSCENAVDVMRQFCLHELGGKTEFRDGYNKLVCFYVFCAGPEVPSGQKGSSHHSKDHWPKYGTEFAQFIVDNGLGEVQTLGPKRNLKHHAATTAQVWIWSPNQKAVETWWNDYQKVNKAPPRPKTPKVNYY